MAGIPAWSGGDPPPGHSNATPVAADPNGSAITHAAAARKAGPSTDRTTGDTTQRTVTASNRKSPAPHRALVATAGQHLGELIGEIDSSRLLDWTPGTYEEMLSAAVDALSSALAAAPDTPAQTPAAWAGRADAGVRVATSALSALVDTDPALAGQMVTY